METTEYKGKQFKKNHCQIRHEQDNYRASQMARVVKNSSANAGDKREAGSIPGSGRSPREGHGNPLQHSCLENPMDRD